MACPLEERISRSRIPAASDGEMSTNALAAVADKNVYGTQFHTEKSGNVGLSILKAFCEL